MADYVVTVTPTIGDGTVVRWHENVGDALAVCPFVSASRNAVVVHGSTLRTDGEHEELRRVLDHAFAVRSRIMRGDDVRDLATHERHGFGAPLAPVQR